MIALACLFFWAASPAASQVLYGPLVGNVTDSEGAAAPGAKVSIKEAGANRAGATTTNEAGLYSFSTLPAGRYEIQVAREGFKNFTRSGIEISINTTTRVDVALQVGPVSETMQVSAAPPALQTDRSEVRAELGAQQLRDLPIPPGRNYQALFKLIPGMSPPNNLNTVVADPSRSLVFNTNGASRSSNNFRIDGSGVNAVWLPHNAGYTPTLEAIETVNVATNSFDAEQGLAGGSASNVLIKSGTNAIHGSAFEFNNNNATKAKPFILPAGQRKPKSIFNQFGATIGGPILRDKLFYFGSYEGTIDRQNVSAFATVPTEGMRRGDLSGSPTLIYDPATGAVDGSGRTAFAGNQIPVTRIDPIAQRILNRLPLPNVADALTDNYFATGPYSVNRKGKAFSAGGDLRMMRAGELPPAESHTFIKQEFGGIVKQIASLDIPVIAAVNGYAMGVGLFTILACDLVIASEQAQFGTAYIHLGLMPLGVSYLLAKTVGYSRAYELCALGDVIDARRAEALGLVNRVTPHDRLLEEASALAQRLAAGPPRALGFTKKLLRQALHSDLENHLMAGEAIQPLCLSTEDHREVVRAFSEERTPRFAGR